MMMDEQHIKEEKQRETLDRILGELRGYVARTVFNKCLRESYEKRWEMYHTEMKQLRTNGFMEQEKQWRNDLVTILTNFDAFDQYAESGEIDMEQFNEFIKDVEGSCDHLLKSSTLKKLFNQYKQKLEDYTSNNNYEKPKVKRKRVKRTDNSEE